MSLPDPVTDYAVSVLDRNTVAGPAVRWACERHMRDLERDDVYLDLEEVQRRIRFAELFAVHIAGPATGQPMVLEPWSEFRVGSVFGWKRVRDDRRRFRTSFHGVARKNNKSTEAAFVGHSVYLQDRDGGIQIYCIATKKDQAKKVFDPAVTMAHRSPRLRSKYNLRNQRAIVRIDDRASTWRYLGKDSRGEDGHNPSLVIVDELHAHEDGDMVNVMRSARGARLDPHMWIVTTAGTCGGYGLQQWQHYYDLIDPKNPKESDTTFVYMAMLDEGDEPLRDPSCWVKTNPMLDAPGYGEILREHIADDVELAQIDSSAMNETLSKRFNIWTAQAENWLNLERWDDCGNPIDLAKLRGRPCYVGMDLSRTTDLTALVLYFPEDGGAVLPFFWVPEDQVERRVRSDRVPYDLWVSQGLIQTTPGDVVDYAAIRAKLSGMVEVAQPDGRMVTEKRGTPLVDLYDIREVAYDPWNAQGLVTQLQDHDGLPMVKCRPGMATLSSASKELEKLVLQRKLRHGGHEVLRWNAGNAAVKRDVAENLMPDKDKSFERIDGIMALVSAISRSMVFQEEERPYSGHRLLTAADPP